MICEIFFSSASSQQSRIILVLEVFYDLHYCIIARGSRGHYFLRVRIFSSEETFDFNTGVWKSTKMSHFRIVSE